MLTTILSFFVQMDKQVNKSFDYCMLGEAGSYLMFFLTWSYPYSKCNILHFFYTLLF